HRFDFSGETRKRGAQTATDQILRSLNRQAQSTRDIGEDQENLVGESSQLDELDQLAEYSGSLRLGRWLFVGTLLAIPVFLWAFGLFPRILSFWSLQRNRIGGERAGVSLPKLFSSALNSLIVNANSW